MRIIKWAVTIFILSLLLEGNAYGQELIRNGSFENGDCPETINDSIFVCESWFSVGTADYFHECSKGEVHPMDNFMGSQQPFSGKAYVGIFCDDANEILYTKLQSQLEEGESYRLSFRYSLAKNSGFINKLGSAFSNELAYEIVDSPFGVGHSPLFELNYSLIESDSAFLSDDKNWNLFEKEFIAKGGERYLYISGMPDDGESCVKRKEAPPVMTYADYAYYYIDDVSLVKQDADGSYPTLTPEVAIKDESKAEKDYSFSNIYFETNSHNLNDTSTSSLGTLVEVLQENPAWSITIQGHADAVGDEKKNLTLSEERADAVKKYLLSNGIEAGRIKIEAMGSSIPLSPNSSEEERAKNRRVEISLVKD